MTINDKLNEFKCEALSINYHQNYFIIPINGTANLVENISLFPSAGLDVGHSETVSPCQICMYAILSGLLHQRNGDSDKPQQCGYCKKI